MKKITKVLTVTYYCFYLSPAAAETAVVLLKKQ